MAYKKHLAMYHFSEITTPIIERTELYRDLSGTSGDTPDNYLLFLKDKNLISSDTFCLRPTAIPSIIKIHKDLPQPHIPHKTYTTGPMFHYMPHSTPAYKQTESIDTCVVGGLSISHDAQLITMLDRFFSCTLPLNGYALTLNVIGCAEDQKAYFKKLQLFLQSNKNHGLCNSCTSFKDNRYLHTFACKNTDCKTILQQAPRIIDNLCTQCAQDWVQIQEQLDLLSVTYIWNPALIPAQTFYKKIIFEFTSVQQNECISFCNGGRCDDLTYNMDRNLQQARAATLYIESLLKLTQRYKDLLPLEQSPMLTVILPVEAEQHMLASLLADTLRSQGLYIDILLETDSLKSMLRHANSMGASYCLILGPQEQQEHKVSVKNMVTGTEDMIKQTEAYAYLTR
jgi:histidyl-tRNA synthetase